MDIKTPIYNKLKTISQKKIYDFQFPGHKKRIDLGLDFNTIPFLDTTETYETDNLHDPNGIIYDSMREVSRVYGTKESVYMVNGSTAGIHIAMLSCTKPGDTILMQRNSHIASYNGSIIGRIKTEYIMPKYDSINQIVGGIDVDEFKDIVENKAIEACVLLHPSFHGLCSDLAELIKIAHDNDVIVIVDEAHGPHLSFTDKLPKSAIELGADIVIHSAHKTLPSITQTAILHICSDRVDINRVYKFSRLLQTTSPSYVFMTAIEKAVAFMDSPIGKQRMDELINSANEFYTSISKIDRVKLLEDNDLYFNRDFTKIFVQLKGIRGVDLRDTLHYEYGVDMEYADYKHVVGSASVMNESDDFKMLAKFIGEISKNKPYEQIDEAKIGIIKPIVGIPIYEAFNLESRRINLKDSVGNISGSYIVPYPPGIPQLTPGEIIQREHVELVEELKRKGISIVGFNEDSMIDIIEV